MAKLLYSGIFLILIGCAEKRGAFQLVYPIVTLSNDSFVSTKEYEYTMDSSLGVYLVCKSQQKVAKGDDSVIIIYQNTKNDLLEYSLNTNDFIGKWKVLKYDNDYNKQFGIKYDSFSNEFATFSYYNPDSVILLYNSFLFFCDDKFKINSSFNIENIIKQSYPLNPRFIVAGHNNKFLLQKYNEYIIGCKVRNFKAEVENDREDSTWFFLFNTKTSKVEIFPIPIPPECKDYVWGYEDGAQYGLVANKSLYISYPYSEEITIFDLEKKSYTKKNIKSSFHDKKDISSVMSQKQFLLLNKLNQTSKLWEKYILQTNSSAAYSNLLYEPKYNRFVRIYFDSQPIRNKEGLFNLKDERNAYMMVFNKDLEIQYEVDLGRGYNDYFSFTSFGKVHINYKYQNPYDFHTKNTFKIKAISFNN